MSKRKWHVIGDVCIDSGTLVVCDPCHAAKVAEWDLINEKTGDFATLDNEYDRTVAVATTTGLGDGMYRVSARYEDAGDYKGCVAELRVVFLPHPGMA